MATIHFVTPSRYRIQGSVFREPTQEIANKFGYAGTEIVNVVFVGTRKMKTIARTYKHENVALPVLSFPYASTEPSSDGEPPVAAEIIICYPQAVLLAAERNKKVTDMILWLLNHAFETIKRSDFSG